MTDIDNTQMLIFETAIEFITNALTVILVSAWLFILNWQFTTFLLLLIPIYIFISNKMGDKIFNVNTKINQLFSEATSIISESVAGIEVIKSYTAYNTFSKKIHKNNIKFS